MLTLLIDSDLHFGGGGIRSEKRDNVEKIIDFCTDGDVDALICAGDLTNRGMDNKFFLQCCVPAEREVSNLIEQYLDPLAKHVGVYLCRGNHDKTTKWMGLYKPLDTLLVDKHGGLRYTFELKGYKFICLDICPNDESLIYLTNVFLSMENKEQPVILFWHYNLTGKWSDWWPEENKQRLHSIITGFNINVVLIIVGHAHISQQIKWNDINVVSGAGEGLAKYTIDNDTTSFQIL